MSNFYETMYIMRPDISDEAVDNTIGKYQGMITEKGGEVIETQHRGKRRLSYEINRFREGIYIQMNYKAPGDVISPMEKDMRLSEDIIRYLTLVVDEPQESSEVDEAPPQAAPLGS
ncbi:MAG: 30S ribosomal protein S6 [Leptolyngbya sp. SIO3F4]|nr:30S ribosomal protein S6 [Leptolyngbya sp. SIO3F4]